MKMASLRWWLGWWRRMAERSSSSHDKRVGLASPPGAWLRASVSPQCPTCSAPGRYGDHPSLLAGVLLPNGKKIGPWPHLYRPAWKNQAVGDRCPQCQALRPENVDKGEIAKLPRGWFFGNA